MPDIKVLNRRRGTLKSKITRLNTFVNDNSIIKDDVIVLNSKLATLEQVKSQLEDLRLEYYEILEEKDVAINDTIFEEMELDIENLEVSLFKLKTSISKNSVKNSVIDNKMNIKLPDVPIPKFSGNIEDWNNFKTQFNSLITSNAQLDESRKLFYLQSALVGSAKQIQTTEDNFCSLFKALEERYENKRLLVNTHINELLNLEKINHESAVELRSIVDKVIKNVRALNSLNLELDKLSENIIMNIVLQKIDKESRKLFELSLENSDLPLWEDFICFLKKRCQFLENVQGNSSQTKMKFINKAKSLHVDSKSSTCIICNGDFHYVYKCPEFLKVSAKERFNLSKRYNLCLRCFSTSHRVSNCSSKYNCRFCFKSHNSLLHIPLKLDSNRNKNKNDVSESSAPNIEMKVTQANKINSVENKLDSIDPVCASTSCLTKTQTVLATAIVYAQNEFGIKQPLRFLCDSGSMINALSRDAVNLLRLKQQKLNIQLSGLNDVNIPVKSKVFVEISNSSCDFVRVAEFLVLPKITTTTPARLLNINVHDLNLNFKLADPEFFKPGKIDGLIGADLFFDMLRERKFQIKDSNLILQESAFGFLISGSISSRPCNNAPYCGLLSEGNSINVDDTLKRFWEIESITNPEPILSSEEMECEKHFLETYSRASNGRYIVQMPLKTNERLGDSRGMAVNRLNSLWKRLSRDPKLQSLYIDFIREYQNLGHMEEVFEDQEPENCYYLPHHGVYRPEKTSTKLRVVFNGSAVTSSGISLNHLQKIGKIPQQDLFSIMLRFRKHVYVFIADVRMMYRQVLIHPSQRDLLRILWREGPNKPIKTFRLCTITYGTSSAPFLATRTLKQLCKDEEESFPEAAAVAQQDIYIDDVLSGSQELESAIHLKQKLIELLERGKMSLHKWSSNSDSLIGDNSNNEQYSFDDENSIKSVKALGILWNPQLDSFSYQVNLPCKNMHTKRTVLSDISRIFDPLGLIGPVVTKAKIFIQSLWLLHLEWDDPLPEALNKKWLEFASDLAVIQDLSIPRYFINNESITLHGFADASAAAYGAAVYAQCISFAGEISVQLLCSKSRVSPIKTVTIPRLELCAALLLSQLIQRVIKALQIKVCSTVLWTDSTIVLAWLKKSPHELKTFVCNRVLTIQELTRDFQWRHVSSTNNPADIISRGLAPKEILNQELWWHGPSFLSQSTNAQETSLVPELVLGATEYNCELKNPNDICLSCNITNSVFSYVVSVTNDYVKLIRILSYVFRYLHNSKKGNARMLGSINAEEFENAEFKLLKWVQHDNFGLETRQVKEGKPLSGKSILKSLNPFCDNYEILRVGGRLENSNLNFDQKHQIILPSKSKITYLILEYLHKKHHHIGPQALLYLARQRFWPVNGRNLARKITHNCVTCVRNKPITVDQLMGNPPPERVNISSPFTNTGVDYSGPYYIRYRNQRRGTLHKVYVAIFICMVTKAIHIEMVTDLSSNAFIATLKRFFARRGKCNTLFSDNATNFVGAHSELKQLHNLVANPDEKLGKFLTSEGINWKFIPPGSPNFGGLWEAGVKSFKHHFKRAVGNSNFYYEEFSTIITEIEGILNSSPLTPISTDINDLEALTPGHFLIGRPITTIAEPDITQVPENRLSRWKRVEKVTQIIWKRWSLEYLSHFQQRQKWQILKKNIEPGMMVVLRENNLPKCNWILGRIVDTISGPDGYVRVVNVRTAHGILKRAISKICILPVNSEN